MKEYWHEGVHAYHQLLELVADPTKLFYWENRNVSTLTQLRGAKFSLYQAKVLN